MKPFNLHYTLPKRGGGGIMLDMSAIAQIVTEAHPGFTRVGIKAKGQNVEWLVVETGHSDAHCLVEYFNEHFNEARKESIAVMNHFKKESAMNTNTAKISDYVDLITTTDTEVRLYAQDIMSAKLEAGDDEDTCNLSVVMQNGRARAWTLGNAAAHDFSNWANAQRVVLTSSHEEGCSQWRAVNKAAHPEIRSGEKDAGNAALNALHNDNMSAQMQSVYGAVEDRLGVLFNMGHGENLFKSNEFRKDFVKALTLSIGTVARAIALEECTTLHDHMLTEHGLAEKQDDITLPEEDAEALEMAKFFSKQLGVPVDDVNVIRIDSGKAPDHLIDALRQAMKKPGERNLGAEAGPQRVPMGLLPENALEALKDVVTHRDDFLRAIRTLLAISAANGDDGDAEYWKHQEKVLMRMDAQARAAIKAHERVPA